MSSIPSPAQHAHTEEGPREVTQDVIYGYVWNRYVDHGPAPFELDEEQALAVLERHYKSHPIQQDAECFYYGILAYEYSFAAPPERRDFYRSRALEAFIAYDDLTRGVPWEPVSDRLQDLRELLEQAKRTSP